MSNILIIKHGSLGDIVQISGVLKDIWKTHINEKIFILTTFPYVDLLSRCPFIDGVIIDKRLPRCNIFYLLKLKKTIERFSFTKVFDLQNSSRTKFYRNIFFKNIDFSSTETSLDKGQKKSDFDQEPVLKRMKIQLQKSGISTNFTENPDLNWAVKNVQSLMNQYIDGNYIAIFPFCSSKHKNKLWPYFSKLIKELKNIYGNKYNIVIAPGPKEIDMAKKLNANVSNSNDLVISPGIIFCLNLALSIFIK